jgi:HEAT repeat protein
MVRSYFVRCQLPSFLALVGCLLAAGCGTPPDAAAPNTAPSVAMAPNTATSGSPDQVQQPVEPTGDVEPAERPMSSKTGRSARASRPASTATARNETFDGALAYVREAQEPDVLFALANLARADHYPELQQARADAERRTIMAAAILKLFNEHSQNIIGGAAGALPAWVVPDNLPAILALLEKTNTPHRDLVRALGEIPDPRSAEVLGTWFPKEGRVASAAFQKLGPALAEKEVLKFLHHPDNNSNGEARKILQAFKTSDDALVDQTLLDLKAADPKRRFAAASWVEQRDLQAPRRAELAKAVEPLVAERQANVFQPAIKALLKLGTADNIPAFEAFLKSGIPYDRRDIYHFLGKTKDARAAVLLVHELDARDRGVARDALKECGPAAEGVVCKVLEGDQRQARLDAVNVLQVIGTKASVPSLEKAKNDKDPMVKEGAKKALKLIAER